MSDHDTAPDPMDKAYVEAEGLLDDQAARAARRARVLAAVAGEAETPSAPPAPARRRSTWRNGGWLAAASVAGLSALVASRTYLTTPPPQSPQAVATIVPAREVPAPQGPAAEEVSPKAEASARPLKPAHRTAAAAPSQTPAPVAVGQSLAVPAPPLAPLSAPPPAHTAEARLASPPVGLVAQGRVAPAAPALAAAPRASVEELVVVTSEKPSGASETDPGAELRAAAAAGRLGKVKALLAKGVAVDAADEAGETALMKSVKADQPTVAALLRRHGASLDLKNQAGETAKDMAMAVGDARLERALDLGR